MLLLSLLECIHYAELFKIKYFNLLWSIINLKDWTLDKFIIEINLYLLIYSVSCANDAICLGLVELTYTMFFILIERGWITLTKYGCTCDRNIVFVDIQQYRLIVMNTKPVSPTLIW